MRDLNWVESKLGDDALNRLHRKLSGGKANQNGYEFELFNCIAEIVSVASAYDTSLESDDGEVADHPNAVRMTQGCLAFVDDIMIETPDRLRFIQVKSTSCLTWDAKLFEDFQNQYDWLMAYGKKFELVLVTISEGVRNNLISGRSKYTFDKAIIISRNPDETEWVEKIKSLVTGVPSLRNARLLHGQLTLAWMESNREEFMGETLSRAKEKTRGMIKAFQKTPVFLQEIIGEIKNLDNDVLTLSADGLSIMYHIQNEEDEIQGVISIENWCAAERELINNPPQTAIALITQIAEGLKNL
ncbi:hypothetical protein [Ochrobactrum teleogrylli]|uniref:Uncharacterized protein n=1 Tax=Ochrobactrum teleogrylli TaxID=2479765 RepID=A0ABD5JSV6_9HYPH